VQAVQPDSGVVEILTDDPDAPTGGCFATKISPDGEHVAFITSAGTYSLYVMNVDGSERTLITDEGLFNFAWSGDGRQLVYTAPLPGSEAIGLVFVDADGSQSRPSAYAGISILPDVSPIAWSPDGQWVCAPVADPADQLAFPYLFNQNGVDFVPLGDQNISPDQPLAWSPDSQQAAFVWHGQRGDFDATRIVIAGVYGGSQAIEYDDPLSQSPFSQPEGLFTGGPYWSPDGSRLLVFGDSNIYPEYHVLAVTLDPLSYQMLAISTHPLLVGTWSPDGSRVVYLVQADPDQGWLSEMMILSAGGGEPHSLGISASAAPLVWIER